MAINDLYTATFRFESISSGFHTTMSYKQTVGTNDQDTMTALAAAIAVLVEAPFKAALSEDVSFTGIVVNQTVGQNETPGRTRFVQPNLGTVMSDAIPMGGCAVLSMLTDAPNSRFNGRMFISGIGESGELNGAVTAAQITLLAALAVFLGTTLTSVGSGSATFVPSVISRFDEGIKRVPPIAFKILSITPDLFIKNQRRRNTRFIGAGAST